MHSLADIQKSIEDVIFNISDPKNFIKPRKGLTIDDCVGVHRSTVMDNLVKNLEISYPGIWKLIGDDCAKGVALAYIHDSNHLVTRSNISDFGKDFPGFVQDFPSTKDLPYLSDYAKLEWFKSLAYSAPAYDLIEPSDLQLSIANDLESSKFILNSSISFLRSEFPLMDIQDLLDGNKSESLNLKKTDCFVVICRSDHQTHCIYLQKEKWMFLKSVHEGMSIFQAMEYLNQQNLESQLSEMINLMIGRKMISGIV